MIRLNIPNTFDLEREVEEELRRRVNTRNKKDLDALLRDFDRLEILNHDPETEAMICEAILTTGTSLEIGELIHE